MLLKPNIIGKKLTFSYLHIPIWKHFLNLSFSSVITFGTKIGGNLPRTNGFWLANWHTYRNFVLIKYFWIFIFQTAFLYFDDFFCFWNNSIHGEFVGSNVTRSFQNRLQNMLLSWFKRYSGLYPLRFQILSNM